MYASYHKPDESPVAPSPTTDLSTSRAMGRVYLYMGLALLISALFAFGFGALFAGLLTDWTYDLTAINYNNSVVFISYVVTLIVSGIGVLIIGIALHAVMARGKHSVWPAFVIYSILMGVLMSAFLVIGIDFATLGEAFAIAAVAFLIMGLIGFFSKKDLNILSMVAFAALIGLSLLGVTMLVVYFVSPSTFRVISIVYSVIVLAVLLIMVAVDTYNIKKIMSTGSANNNMCLYCAYIMYTDFIHLFVRVLILLLRMKRN